MTNRRRFRLSRRLFSFPLLRGGRLEAPSGRPPRRSEKVLAFTPLRRYTTNKAGHAARVRLAATEPERLRLTPVRQPIM